MSEDISYRDKPWLKSYDPGIPEKIHYELLTLPEILEHSAIRFSDQAALLYQGYSMSFRQFNESVDQFASFLSAQGVRRGQAVAILLPNCIPCVIAYYAVLRIGGIVVLNNPLYTDPELLHQFNDSEACFLITIDLLCNRMISLREKTKIKQIVYVSLGDYLPFQKKIVFRVFGKRRSWSAPVREAPEVFSWRKCIREASLRSCSLQDVGFHDVAVYAYTGGTTGLPKGVELTHANLSKQVQQCAAWFPAFKKGSEIMLGALPYFHTFGMTTTMNLSVYMGWTQLLVPKPQSGPLLEAIRKYRPTFAPLVPTMYAGMLKHPDFSKTDMSCLKGAFSGGAPLSEDLKRNFEQKTGAIIVEGYGMTETSPVTLINPFAHGAQKEGSVGLPISDTLCRIVDLEEGISDVPLGQRGELIIKGPQVMRGYKGKPAETAEIIRNGWCYTGDIAVMDSDGYVFLVDRKKDLILSGGYNIYPHEIEAVLNSHPKIQESCAVGIPDEKKGEKVKVFIILKEGETATKQELLDFCRERLAAYKLPAEIEFRTELPKSHLGKILRRKL